MIRTKQYFLLAMLLFLWQGTLRAQTITQRKIDSLNAVLKNAKEDTTKVWALGGLCGYYNTAGEIQKAREAGETAVRLADKINFKSGKASALNNLANMDWASVNLQEAMDKYNICAKINEEIGNKLELGFNLNNIGNIHYVKADYAEAIKYYKRAIKAYEEVGSKKWIANTYNNLSAVIEEQGNYPEALKYLFTGLKMLKEAGIKDLSVIFYLNIGTLYLKLMNYPEAMKYYQTYLAVAQEVGNKEAIAGAFAAIGRVYEKKGNYTDALANFSVALKAFIELGNKDPVAGVYTEFGTVYLHQSNYSEALKNFNAAVKIYQELGYNERLANSYINIGDILSKQAALEKDQEARNKKYNDAIQILNKGLSLAKDKGARESIKNGYAVLSDVYRKLNDHKKALEYHDLYVQLKDSILNNETTRKVEQQRTLYEVELAVAQEKIKNEIALAEQKAERTRKNQLLMGSIAILAVISFLIALLIRQRNQKKRAIEKAETGHKMAELELQSLRAQLNPHFMFNSLNAIQDLILKEDNHRSHLYLSRFSKLLRMLLDNANQPFVSVKQEIEFLELYLSLENLRIPDLQFSIEKDPEINTEERMVPNMMLQPYIENAIWHGLSHKKENRKLQIRIHETENATEFEIEDNGVGRQKAAEMKSLYRKGHTSKGMELLSKRFNLLSKEYGEAIQTTVTDLANNGDATGTLVKIDVPFSLSTQAKKSVHDTNHHH